MTEKYYKYLPKEQRKKVLLLADDIRTHSGIATMAREFVVGTAQHFNWLNLGAAINHPDIGKILDLSESVNKVTGLEDSDVRVIPNNGYGDVTTVRNLIRSEKPSAIFIFTDPRYWTWLFEIEREIRSKIPIIWLSIWDNWPVPEYNYNYYASCDTLLGISKQTHAMHKMLLESKDEFNVIELQ